VVAAVARFGFRAMMEDEVMADVAVVAMLDRKARRLLSLLLLLLLPSTGGPALAAGV